MKDYPVFLRLADELCVVVGGDRLVEEKVIGLLESGAVVKLVDPAPTGALLDLAATRRLTHVARGYRPGDLSGAFLANSGRNERPIIDSIVAEASRARAYHGGLSSKSTSSKRFPSVAPMSILPSSHQPVENAMAISTGVTTGSRSIWHNNESI